MSEQQHRVAGDMHGAGAVPPLSPQRAFVVQFRAGPAGAPVHFSGRIEHITSGQAARFSSLEELTEFIRQVLADIREV